METREGLDPSMAPPTSEGDAPRTLGILGDIEVEVTVELGRRRLRIVDATSLKSGQTLELDKLAGEPLELRVNGKLVARGDAIVIGEHYAMRVTEIIRGEGAR